MKMSVTFGRVYVICKLKSPEENFASFNSTFLVFKQIEIDLKKVDEKTFPKQLSVLSQFTELHWASVQIEAICLNRKYFHSKRGRTIELISIFATISAIFIIPIHNILIER